MTSHDVLPCFKIMDSIPQSRDSAENSNTEEFPACLHFLLRTSQMGMFLSPTGHSLMMIKDSRAMACWPKHQVWGGVFGITQVHVHIVSFTARDLGPAP